MESAYLGPRLVSRSKRGALPRGPAIRIRGAPEGPYRGSPDVRVCFDGDECRLEIDGEARTAVASPLSDLDLRRISRFQRGRRLCVSCFVLAFCSFGVGLWMNRGAEG